MASSNPHPLRQVSTVQSPSISRPPTPALSSRHQSFLPPTCSPTSLAFDAFLLSSAAITPIRAQAPLSTRALQAQTPRHFPSHKGKERPSCVTSLTSTVSSAGATQNIGPGHRRQRSLPAHLLQAPDIRNVSTEPVAPTLLLQRRLHVQSVTRHVHVSLDADTAHLNNVMGYEHRDRWGQPRQHTAANHPSNTCDEHTLAILAQLPPLQLRSLRSCPVATSSAIAAATALPSPSLGVSPAECAGERGTRAGPAREWLRRFRDAMSALPPLPEIPTNTPVSAGAAEHDLDCKLTQHNTHKISALGITPVSILTSKADSEITPSHWCTNFAAKNAAYCSSDVRSNCESETTMTTTVGTRAPPPTPAGSASACNDVLDKAIPWTCVDPLDTFFVKKSSITKPYVDDHSDGLSGLSDSCYSASNKSSRTLHAKSYHIRSLRPTTTPAPSPAGSAGQLETDFEHSTRAVGDAWVDHTFRTLDFQKVTLYNDICYSDCCGDESSVYGTDSDFEYTPRDVLKSCKVTRTPTFFQPQRSSNTAAGDMSLPARQLSTVLSGDIADTEHGAFDRHGNSRVCNCLTENIAFRSLQRRPERDCIRGERRSEDCGHNQSVRGDCTFPGCDGTNRDHSRDCVGNCVRGDCKPTIVTHRTCGCHIPVKSATASAQPRSAHTRSTVSAASPNVFTLTAPVMSAEPRRSLHDITVPLVRPPGLPAGGGLPPSSASLAASASGGSVGQPRRRSVTASTDAGFGPDVTPSEAISKVFSRKGHD